MNIIKRDIPTTNYDTSRKIIDRIVIHWFGTGTLASADARFKKVNEQASAHYGVSDSTIYQWVDEAHTAYHAGNYAMNQRSIGIEHDATTTKNATEETYKTSAELIKAISIRHRIPLDREHIIGHEEVSATQCPGTLDIDYIIKLAKGESEDDISPSKKLPDEFYIINEAEQAKGLWGLTNQDAWDTALNRANNKVRELDTKIKGKDVEIKRLQDKLEEDREITIGGFLEKIKDTKVQI